MNRKSTIFVSLAALGLIVGYLVWQIPAKKKYDELLASDISLSVVEIEDEQFLAEVISSWKILVTQCPDESMTPALKLVGEDITVEGAVRLVSHDPSTFSFISTSRNKSEAVYMAVKSLIIPITVDDAIHKGEGVAYLRLRENVVEVYRDTENGIKNTVYHKE